MTADSLKFSSLAARQVYAGAMRIGLWALMASLWATLAWTSEAAPLRQDGADLSAVVPTLKALSQGNLADLDVIPADIFCAAIGLPDPEMPSVIRRWTDLLAVAIEPLSADQRQQAIAALEQRYQILTSISTPEVRHQLALAFRLTPAAQRYIRDQADRAFDRGQFRTYQQWLAPALTPTNAHQFSISQELGGFAATVDLATRLPIPGPLRAAPPLVVQNVGAENDSPPAAQPGITITWHEVPGWLLAHNAIGEVAWQTHIPAQAQVLLGDGGALIRTIESAVFWDEYGRHYDLPPMPAAATPRCISAGTVWITLGTTVYQWSPQQGLNQLALPDPAVTVPVMHGPDSYWLTAQDIILVQDNKIHARFRHNLPITPRWNFIGDHDHIYVQSPTGDRYLIENLEQVLPAASTAEASQLLLEAYRHDEVLAHIATHPDVLTDPGVNLVYARALVIDHQFEQALPFIPQDLPLYGQALLLARQQAPEAWTARAAAWCEAHPNNLLAPNQTDILALPAAQNWIIRSDLAASYLREMAVPAPTGLAGPQSLSTAVIGPQRQPHGAWQWNHITWTMAGDNDTVTITCRDNQNQIRWRQQWSRPPVGEAPDRELFVDPLHVLVCEGTLRCLIFDAHTGSMQATIPLNGQFITTSELAITTDFHLGSLQPPWLHTHLHVISNRGATVVELPQRAEWIQAVGTNFIIKLADQSWYTWPQQLSQPLPDELEQGHRPERYKNGLYRDKRWWPYLSAAGAVPVHTPTTTTGSLTK